MVECHICGEDFARKDVLSRHLKRKYPCDGSRSRQKDESEESSLAQDMDHEVLGTSYLCTSRSIEQAQVDIEVRLGKALKHTMTIHLNDN